MWTEETFDKLVAGTPEKLVSRMRVDNSTLINVITREEDAFPVLRRLLQDNHEARAQPAPAQPPGAAAGPQPGALRRTAASGGARRVRPAVRADRRAARGLRAQPAARALRARGARGPRPRVRRSCSRRRLGHRGGPGGAAAGALRAAASGPRRRDRRDEGRRDGVRRADAAARRRDLAAAARRAAGGDVRDLPGAAPVAARGRAGPEGHRARDVRERDELHRLRRALPAGPLRGARPALPDRRLPDPAADRSRGVPRGRAGRPRGVAGRDDPADRLLAARRVGGAERPGPRGPVRHRARATRLAATDLEAGAAVPGDGAQRHVAPGRPGRPRRPRRSDGARAGRSRSHRSAARRGDDAIRVGLRHRGVLRRARRGADRRRRARSGAAPDRACDRSLRRVSRKRTRRPPGSGGSPRPSPTPRVTATG